MRTTESGSYGSRSRSGLPGNRSRAAGPTYAIRGSRRRNACAANDSVAAIYTEKQPETDRDHRIPAFAFHLSYSSSPGRCVTIQELRPQNRDIFGNCSWKARSRALGTRSPTFSRLNQCFGSLNFRCARLNRCCVGIKQRLDVSHFRCARLNRCCVGIKRRLDVSHFG
jgi:hypothetical protein